MSLDIDRSFGGIAVRADECGEYFRIEVHRIEGSHGHCEMYGCCLTVEKALRLAQVLLTPLDVGMWQVFKVKHWNGVFDASVGVCLDESDGKVRLCFDNAFNDYNKHKTQLTGCWWGYGGTSLSNVTIKTLCGLIYVWAGCKMVKRLVLVMPESSKSVVHLSDPR